MTRPASSVPTPALAPARHGTAPTPTAKRPAGARQALPLNGSPVPRGTARPLLRGRQSLPAPAAENGRATPRAVRPGPSTPIKRNTTPRPAGRSSIGEATGCDAVESRYRPPDIDRTDPDSSAIFGFPDIVTEPSVDLTDDDGASWELRTETAQQHEEDYDDDEDYNVYGTSRLSHSRQITHYKNLLVRSQSASSAALHELHAKLYKLEKAHAVLKAAHELCGLRRKEEEERKALEERVLDGVKSGSVVGALKGLSRDERIGLLGVMAEACHPSEINAQIAILDRYRRSRYDILPRLGDDLVVKVLTLLEVKDLLSLKMVSREYSDLTRLPELWKRLCRQLEWRDWDGQAGLAHLLVEPDGGWNQLYRRLWQRERNWNAGRAQSVHLLKGHTNYVTSLRLRGDTLISGSYDETIRIWNLASKAPPTVLSARSVSCLDYHPPNEVFVVGYHDIGRVQVWRKARDEWEVTHTLSGHLHGIRAVALNDKWLVSAGADKALVVWSWRTGEKIVRFGQQTNICVGIQLIHDHIVSVTVDGVIRTFSIRKREMVAQYRIADLGRDLGAETRTKLRDVGGGAGGVGMLTWFEGQGRHMTCSTREVIIRLSWDETEEDIPLDPLPSEVSPSKPFSSPRARTDSLAARATTISSPTRQLPVVGQQKSTNLKSSMTPTTPSPLRRKSALTSSTGMNGRASPSISIRTTSTSPNKFPANRRIPSKTLSIPPIGVDAGDPTADPETPQSASDSKEVRRRIVPLLSKAPKILEIVAAPDVEKGAVDARRTRVVTSTRFAARTGADRHLYVGVPTPAVLSPDGEQVAGDKGGTRMIPISGAWAEQAELLHLQTPEKNPMSLVLDRDKFVYGCTDGTIVVVGFEGDRYLE